MDLNEFIREKAAEFAREAPAPREPMDFNEAWFVACLRKHLLDQLWPMLSAIDALVRQLVEQIDLREALARRLAANVAEMRNGSPADTAPNLQQVN
jgi:hypothetical protein